MNISETEERRDDASASGAKVLTLDALGELHNRVARSGECVVLCHGVFDLLHPGHVTHLEQARALGDRLVVSATADEYVGGGPERPVFRDEQRLRTLAALSCVDHVVLVDDSSALPVIRALQPAIYCKGPAYSDPNVDVDSNFEKERSLTEQLGGEVRLLGGPVYSSTRLVNTHFEVLPEPARAFAEDFRGRHDRDEVRTVIEGLQDLSVLVIGEVIIDEYILCEAQGVTVKERVPSVLEHERHQHWGGSYAVARHFSEVCGNVTVAGIAGPSDPLAAMATPSGASDKVERAVVTDPSAHTIVKQRYVVENKLRAELAKLFAVHHVPDPSALGPGTRSAFRELLSDLMTRHDLVVVTDYGHGLLDETTMLLIQEEAPFLALNCQTNSSNYGFNLITKYERADVFCLDQIELRLAYQETRTDNGDELLERLRDRLGAQAGWLTLGAAGCVGVATEKAISRVPALTLHARDTLGAGDAFFSLASACVRRGEPLEVGSFLGSVAGALAVNITGNAAPVEKHDLIQFASTVLNV